MKVLMNEPLTSMGVDCFVSCENIVPRFQTPPFLPHHPQNGP